MAAAFTAHGGAAATIGVLLDTHLIRLGHPPNPGGLIGGERRGTWVCYWIIPETVNKLGALFAPLSEPASRSDRLADSAVTST